MTTGLLVAVVFFALALILPATLGLVFDRVRSGRPRVEALIRADNAKATATLAYYNDVHDSHSG